MQNKRIHGERIFVISGPRNQHAENEKFYGDLTRLAAVFHYDHIIVLGKEKLSEHVFLEEPEHHNLHLKDFHQQGKVGESSVLIADRRTESAEVYEDIETAISEDMHVFLLETSEQTFLREFDRNRDHILDKKLTQATEDEDRIISFTQIKPNVVGYLLGNIAVRLGKMTDRYRLHYSEEEGPSKAQP